jgi:hypothetical protein
MTVNINYSSGGYCQSGILVAFSGIDSVKPNNRYLVSFRQINSIPSGVIWFYPDYYFLRPINEYASGLSVYTYARIFTNLNLDNSSSSIVELSIFNANDKSTFTAADVPVHRERANIKCGNLCSTSGIPDYTTQLAARIPSPTPTQTSTLTPTPTITNSSTPASSLTPTISQTSTVTPTLTETPTPTPTLTPTLTETVTPTPTLSETPPASLSPTPTLSETPSSSPTPTPTPTL